MNFIPKWAKNLLISTWVQNTLQFICHFNPTLLRGGAILTTCWPTKQRHLQGLYYFPFCFSWDLFPLHITNFELSTMITRTFNISLHLKALAALSSHPKKCATNQHSPTYDAPPSFCNLLAYSKLAVVGRLRTALRRDSLYICFLLCISVFQMSGQESFLSATSTYHILSHYYKCM